MKATHTLKTLVLLLVVTLGATACNGFAWGGNFDGRLGDGTEEHRYLPTAHATDQVWSTISAGDRVTCAINTAGALSCWGDNDDGAVGDGTRRDRDVPTRVGTATDWIAVDAGGEHVCGLRAPGKLYCWGSNDQRQVSGQDGGGQDEPKRVGNASNWVAVSAGASHTCGIRSSQPGSGTLFCWGGNWIGQLGVGSNDDVLGIQQVTTSHTWTAVSAGASHTCGIRGEAGSLLCWGLGSDGQLGNGFRASWNLPASTLPLPSGWLDVTAGDHHTCGRRIDDSARCWGRNDRGQLGTGDFVSTLSPVRLAVDVDWHSLDAGGLHTCGIHPTGPLMCWGSGEVGQLGSPGHIGRDTPFPTFVGDPYERWTMVSAGRLHTEALRDLSRRVEE